MNLIRRTAVDRAGAADMGSGAATSWRTCAGAAVGGVKGISTVSGWVTHRLGGFPKAGDMVLLGLGRGANCAWEEMDSMRVAKLKLTKLPAGGTEFMKNYERSRLERREKRSATLTKGPGGITWLPGDSKSGHDSFGKVAEDTVHAELFHGQFPAGD